MKSIVITSLAAYVAAQVKTTTTTTATTTKLTGTAQVLTTCAGVPNAATAAAAALANINLAKTQSTLNTAGALLGGLA